MNFFQIWSGINALIFGIGFTLNTIAITKGKRNEFYYSFVMPLSVGYAFVAAIFIATGLIK